MLTYPHTSTHTHTLAQLLLVHYHQSKYKLVPIVDLSSDKEWNGKSLKPLEAHATLLQDKENLQAQLEKETKETFVNARSIINCDAPMCITSGEYPRWLRISNPRPFANI